MMITMELPFDCHENTLAVLSDKYNLDEVVDVMSS